MFDRFPDERLVADLVAVQSAAPASSAAQSARGLIDELVAWQRVAAWVEFQRLDVMRRFELARIAADRDLVAGMSAALGAEPPVTDTDGCCDADPIRESASIREAVARLDAALDGVGADEGAIDLSVSQAAALARLEAGLDEVAGRFAAEEIALALNMSPSSVAKQLSLARDLHTVHSDLGEALQLGQVSAFVASMVASATRKLPDTARRVLDEAVTTDAMELPAGRAIDAARNRVREADEYSDVAAAAARNNRYAFLKPLDDSVAMLGAVMPAEDAVAGWARIDTDARRLRREGDPRNLDQLRCDLFAQALASATDGTATCPAAESTASGPGAAASRPAVSVQVVISLASLLGIDSRCGYLDGYGGINPSVIRDLLGSTDVTMTRLLCDPVGGSVMVADPTRYTPTAGLKHATGCRDRHCRLPVCTARVRHLDHIQARVDAGLTTEQNLQGLCERSHLAKHHPGWHVHGDATSVVTWTTPTGHRYTSKPPPATGYGTGPPRQLDDTIDLPGWLSQQQHLEAALQRHRQAGAA